MTKEQLLKTIEKEFAEWWDGVKSHNLSAEKWGSYKRFQRIFEAAEKLDD